MQILPCVFNIPLVIVIYTLFASCRCLPPFHWVASSTSSMLFMKSNKVGCIYPLTIVLSCFAPFNLGENRSILTKPNKRNKVLQLQSQPYHEIIITKNKAPMLFTTKQVCLRITFGISAFYKSCGLLILFLLAYLKTL